MPEAGQPEREGVLGDRFGVHALGRRPDPLAGRAGYAAVAGRAGCAAEHALGTPHPDYWRVLTDLQRVRDETAGVVTRLRGG